MARRANYDDPLCYWLEFRPKMTGAFQRQNLLLARFNPHVSERFLIQRLHPFARHHDADAPNSQKRHQSQIDFTVAGHNS